MGFTDSTTLLIDTFTHYSNALDYYMQDIRREVLSRRAMAAEHIKWLQKEKDEENGSKFPPEQISQFLSEQQQTLLRITSYSPMLMDMAFIYLVAIFDAFLTDILGNVLLQRPDTMKTSKKQLSYEDIIRLQAEGNLINHLVQREVNELSYKSISEQTEYYNKRFNIRVEDSGVDVADLSQIRAARNILIHNNGIVNTIYLEVVPDSPYKLGDRFYVTDEYWAIAHEKLSKVGKHLGEAFLSKFGDAA